MSVLVIFAFSLAATCCSLLIPNIGSGKKELATPKPRTINEAADQIDKYIEEKYSDTSKRLTAEDIHKKWNIKAVQVETALETAMKINFTNMQNELDKLKVELTLRNAVETQFDRIAPLWLQYIPIRTKYKWRLLFQLESEMTECLRFIITNQMNISVVEFCEDMGVFEEQAASYKHQDDLPYLECEDKMMRILESLGFEKGTMKKSLVALIFHFRNLNNMAHFTNTKDYKFHFLYFPSLKALTTRDDISNFVNTYFGYDVVYNDNITLIENDKDEAGGRPRKNIQVFVRLNRTLANQEGKEVDVWHTLKQIEYEIVGQKVTLDDPISPYNDIKPDESSNLCNKTKVEVETSISKTTTAITSLKKSIMDQCGENAIPMIF